MANTFYLNKLSKVQRAVFNELKKDDATALELLNFVNTASYENSKQFRKDFETRKAIWLPSKSKQKRPEHVKNYGKIFTLGTGIDGVVPGELYGCKCGFMLLKQGTTTLNQAVVEEQSNLTAKEKRGIFKSIGEVAKNYRKEIVLGGVAFMAYKRSVRPDGTLTPEGQALFTQAIQAGGGTIEDRLNQAQGGSIVGGRTYDKIEARVIGGKTLEIPVDTYSRSTKKTKRINFNYNYAGQEKKIIINSNGIFLTVSLLAVIASLFESSNDLEKDENIAFIGGLDI